jgi:hypothetical protein
MRVNVHLGFSKFQNLALTLCLTTIAGQASFFKFSD